MRYQHKILLISIIALITGSLKGQSPGWTVNPADFDYNGEINARVYLGPNLVTTGTLGTFVGTTCRGYANGIVFPPTGQTVFSVMCYSNLTSGETLTFKYYNPSDGLVYNVNQTIAFTSDMIEGTAAVPLEFHIDIFRTLNLTGVLLEGLYNGSGTMREAWNDTGPQWGTGIADHITVELHSSTSYSTIVYAAAGVSLMTNGTVTISIPYTYSGTYYITIRHRNSIETTTASPVSFAGNIINYGFDLPSKVYGGNLKLMDGAGNHYAIYSGDCNSDGAVDILDILAVQNDAFVFAFGYLMTDLNGDTSVDVLDLILVQNNAFLFTAAITP